jgi:hypothetical protein
MRYTGESIERAIRLALIEHRCAPSASTATKLAKLRALRALYETSVYANIALPGLGTAQRSLREATECYRILRKLPPDVQRSERRALKRAIAEARKVPMELPEVDFTV